MTDERRPAQRIMEGLDELSQFAAGVGGPLTLWMPDGKGDLVKREVQNIEEYRRIWCEEGGRAPTPREQT